ncbi:MAG: hypothetical protein QGH42_07075 [Kiritimatiellia bacterium]|jgi:hypothetical protein|nr:hypothetical protein [Kiritimatiellia bacterium]MDP6630800.1 hypothetical protein [Kiritimatiellia bacterium]MDP6809336.1 hypothetical protein [Kiritimatiellia bacterium]MDP7023986.1 hypothetical protein [Kiritimatiellia bacterium]
MARKNVRKKRKKQQKMNGYIFPVPFAGIVVVASALALGYVWLGCQCEALGDEIAGIETRGIDLNKKLLNAEYRWVRTKSPQSLEIALQRHGLNMDWPRANQVVRLERAELPRGLDDRALPGDIRIAKVSRNVMHE